MGSLDCKSYLGNAINLNGDGVAWFTHKQHGVAIHSNEAECIVVSDVCKDGHNINHLFSELMQVIDVISIYMEFPGGHVYGEQPGDQQDIQAY